MNTPKITGSCLCGAISYHCSNPPLAARACWCRLCQRLGAGGGTVNACFRRSDVQIAGVLSDYVSTADSGTVMHRRFCALCGTHLFSEAQSRPQLIFVRAGSLDDPELARPQATIWASQAPSWACIASDIPRIEGQPPPVT